MQAIVRSRTLNSPYGLFKGRHDYHYYYKTKHTASLSTFNQRNGNDTKNPILFASTNVLQEKEMSPNRRFQTLNTLILYRNIHRSGVYLQKEPLKPSSKVEVTVQELKKQQENVPEVVKKAPKSLKQRVIDEIVHYYHGFRLLGIDMKISSKLVWRVLNGKSLTRREYRLLMRTTGDMFRLVPFSVFIIVPFMELLLPVFIKFFPGMLPSTFQTATEKEDKIKQNLKVKIEMAKFLQETLDEMSVQHKDRNSDAGREFAEMFTKVRTSGEQISNEEIMKFSKLFQDELTLDALSRSQLIALCRVVEVQTLGTNNFLRFQLRMKLRSLAADDKMIRKEGVASLNLAEVQQACRARGMRAYGLSETRLRSQLSQWLDLSLNEKVPPSLLLLSRAMMLPEAIPTEDKLKATISALPETIVAQTKAAIGEKEGKIDNKVMLEVLKEEERKVKEERREERERKEKESVEVLVDKAPTISAQSTPILEDTAARLSAEKLVQVESKTKAVPELQSKDLEILESAIDTVSKDMSNIVERGEIEGLKEQMADYKEDVDDLKNVTVATGGEVKESKAAQRLFKSVNKMITKLDTVLVDLEKQKLKKVVGGQEGGSSAKTKEELLKIDDIISAINKVKDVVDKSKVDQIVQVLRKLDDDFDGSIKVEDALKVFEIIGKENVKLSDKQIDELIDLMSKEEILQVEDKIEKALQKEKVQVKQAQDKENEAEKTKQTSEKPVTEPITPPTVKVKSDNTSSNNSSSSSSSSSGSSEPKKKFEAKPPIITPPVESIDKKNPADGSKRI